MRVQEGFGVRTINVLSAVFTALVALGYLVVSLAPHRVPEEVLRVLLVCGAVFAVQSWNRSRLLDKSIAQTEEAISLARKGLGEESTP